MKCSKSLVTHNFNDLMKQYNKPAGHYPGLGRGLKHITNPSTHTLGHVVTADNTLNMPFSVIK